MPKVNCAVVGCTNSTYKLNKWKKEWCTIHNILNENCPCKRPFQLFSFPSVKRNYEKRSIWINAMKRKGEKGKTWEPHESVEFAHFILSMGNQHPNIHFQHLC